LKMGGAPPEGMVWPRGAPKSEWSGAEWNRGSMNP